MRNSSLYIAVLLAIFFLQPLLFKTFYASVFSFDLLFFYAILEGEVVTLLLDKIWLVSIVTSVVYLVEFVLFSFLATNFIVLLEIVVM